MTAHELILRGARLIDPAQGLDRDPDVAFADSRVSAVGDDLAVGDGTAVRPLPGAIVTPGLIDLHTHVYWGGTSLGIDAEAYCRRCGVTTAVDTGSAGPGNFAGFRRHVIDPAAVRILAYLHVSFAGIFGFWTTVKVGESEDVRLMAPREAVRVADANREVIVGIKVRVGRNASGSQGLTPLFFARQVAEEVGMPMMVHIDEPPPTYEQVLAEMRPGDVLTHCFRPFPNAPVDGKGEIRAGVVAARQRGIYFDIGHGMGSFAFKTARAMLDHGFLPDTISSDVHALCIDGPAFDQVTTLNKFLHLGMPLTDVIAASTCQPARVLQRPELGTLAPGAVGDATILRLEQRPFELVDVVGERVTASHGLVALGAVIGGRFWHDAA